jgi:hypothetical protein
VCGAWAWACTGAGVDAQEAESDGEEETACAEPDGAEVPTEEAEECVHNLAHPVWGSVVVAWAHFPVLPFPCGCGTGTSSVCVTRTCG